MAEQSSKEELRDTEGDKPIESEDVLLLDEEDVDEEAIEKEIAEDEKKFTPGAIPAIGGRERRDVSIPACP